jgi:hypothetical protein
VTSSSQLEPLFSFNPATNALYVVTANVNTVYTWDPNTSSGVCAGIYAYFTGKFTGTELYTFSLIELTGTGI